ncbi:MAG: substrate-binding domain-containing protein [Desulfomicrobium sp.]|nr:substrate-binding domain-containing protein [Pseudomonadota bacterium]MBV1711864.1 substrate-binding domain-containing protein [Desulfomicrobium sp.]MBU4571041.1 substrate-binding domain-containing protein [Pseudomonadota bacterium]MBU4593670.1 substrate-binding domain-containing protein [Pseudomonadota bacterium]MBV1719074.1 substrate-binding domain-containing protein [Desulfomicrobium sp.]
MADMDESGSSGKFFVFFLALLFVAAVGAAATFFFRPDLIPLSLFSPTPVQSVRILPQEAASEGAQWRMVGQWQGSGEFREAANLFRVEFKPVPGWETPSPVVIGKDQMNVAVEGVYKPAQFSMQTILTLAGASTVANRLAPELAALYLTSIGANEVRTVPGSTADEYSVEGIFYAAMEIRSIQIEGRGTASGFSALKDGTSDVAMATQRLSMADAKIFGPGVITAQSELRLGMDAVSVVVHKDNPVPALTLEQVGGIFAGEISNWDQVGGPSAPIKIFILHENFGTRRFVEDFFMRGKSFAASAQVVDAHDLLPELVSQDPWAIGFCSLTMANQCREVPLKVSPDSEAVLPSPQSIAAQTYPASRNLYLYLKATTDNVYARDFVRVALGGPGQEVVRKFGFVKNSEILAVAEDASGDASFGDMAASSASVFDQEAPPVLKAPALGVLPPLVQYDGEAVPEAVRREVLQEYHDGVYGAEKLPLVFRFESGSLDLDEQALRDVARIAALMREPKHSGKMVVVAGFSDSVGPYASNLAVSRKRAEAVAETLRKRGVQDVLILAAGEEGAIERNDIRTGREKNRRVEIWLK